MSKLAAVCHVIEAEQDTNIAVELRFSASSGVTRPAGNTVRGKIPPQIIAPTFFRVDLAVYRFLADPQWCLFLDHTVADLLWRPTVFDPFNYTFV
jgi:hypothetical protein